VFFVSGSNTAQSQNRKPSGFATRYSALAPLALPSYARALLIAVFSVNTHNDVLVGRVIEPS